jgi:hypothetical protein
VYKSHKEQHQNYDRQTKKMKKEKEEDENALIEVMSQQSNK